MKKKLTLISVFLTIFILTTIISGSDGAPVKGSQDHRSIWYPYEIWEHIVYWIIHLVGGILFVFLLVVVLCTFRLCYLYFCYTYPPERDNTLIILPRGFKFRRPSDASIEIAEFLEYAKSKGAYPTSPHSRSEKSPFSSWLVANLVNRGDR